MQICKTPLRVSFFGGGTDFPHFFRAHGGAVLGMAIDKYIYHAILPFHSHFFEYSIRLSYRKLEQVNFLDEIEHVPFREILRYMDIPGDIEIDLMADLPAFSGLGASSSFVVGLLNGLCAYKNEKVSPMEIAYRAITVEQQILGETVGCQDQVFAAVGGFNTIEFADTDKIKVLPVDLPASRTEELMRWLMLFHTGVRRRAHDIENGKLKNAAGNVDCLLQMMRLVDEGYSELAGGKSLAGFASLLDRSWKLKCRLSSDVTNSKIDGMYELARNAGALGGKVLGAGGGGFLLLCVPPERQERVRNALRNFQEVDFSVAESGSKIISV